MKKLALIALVGLSFQDSKQDVGKEFRAATLEATDKNPTVRWNKTGTVFWAHLWAGTGRQVVVFNGVRSPEYDTVTWADTTEPMDVPVYLAWKTGENPYLVIGDKATRLKERATAVRYDVAGKKAGFSVVEGNKLYWRVQEIP